MLQATLKILIIVVIHKECELILAGNWQAFKINQDRVLGNLTLDPDKWPHTRQSWTCSTPHTGLPNEPSSTNSPSSLALANSAEISRFSSFEPSRPDLFNYPNPVARFPTSHILTVGLPSAHNRPPFVTGDRWDKLLRETVYFTGLMEIDSAMCQEN